MHALEVIIVKNGVKPCSMAPAPDPVKIVRISISRRTEPVVIVADQEAGACSRAERERTFRADAAKLYEFLYDALPWRTFDALGALIRAGRVPLQG